MHRPPVVRQADCGDLLFVPVAGRDPPVIAAELGTRGAISTSDLISVPIGGPVSGEARHASLPSFWIRLILDVRPHVLSIAGYGPPDATVPERLTDLIMPADRVGMRNSALIIRLTRTSMVDVLQEDYVRTARTKSLAQDRDLQHAFRNARTSVPTDRASPGCWAVPSSPKWRDHLVIQAPAGPASMC